jgi:hypothetical protein
MTLLELLTYLCDIYGTVYIFRYDIRDTGKTRPYCYFSVTGNVGTEQSQFEHFVGF